MEMDLLHGVKEGSDQQPGFIDPTNPDVLQGLKDFLANSDKLSDEEKAEIRESLISRAKEAAQGFGTNFPQKAASAGYSSTQIIIFLLVVCFIASVFTYIGYKIYKPMADREKRQAQKKVMKESKKKRR